MLVHISELIERAQKEHYAVGAFNTSNFETTLGIIRGAVAQRSPIIIQVSETTIKYVASLKALSEMVKDLADSVGADVPIALHLDHGKSFRAVVDSVRENFSSIMIDASELPLAENIALTKQSVDYAHQNNVWAQGELGQLRGHEDEVNPQIIRDNLTDPQAAAEFAQATGVDTLAVAVGNIHGIVKMQKVKAHLDIPRLQEINKVVKVPLVLHGASGLPKEQISQAIAAGVRIINIDTEIRLAFTEPLRLTLQQDPQEIDLRKYFLPSIDSVSRLIEEKVAMFGSMGKAK